METPRNVYHRKGQPGGPGCSVRVLPVEARDGEGKLVAFELLDAGDKGGELELLRTVAARSGVKWGKDEFGWWAAVRVVDSRSWSVWRQDDNGNKFLMKTKLTKSEAALTVEHYQSLGHKQMYWSENVENAPGRDG